MGDGTVLDSAMADVGVACAALKRLQTIDFWQIPELDLLAFASSLEGVARLGYAAQVRVAGEVDTRNTAAVFGSSSPASLLRETLCISAADAKARLNAAAMTLPQVQPSGVKTDPVLPELADAMTQGLIGTEQIRSIVATIKGLPADVDAGLLEMAKEVLVQAGSVTEPKPFSVFAKSVALSLDPDGRLNDKNPSDRVEPVSARGTRTPG